MIVAAVIKSRCRAKELTQKKKVLQWQLWQLNKNEKKEENFKKKKNYAAFMWMVM